MTGAIIGLSEFKSDASRLLARMREKPGVLELIRQAVVHEIAQARGALKVERFALVEHCRAIGISRVCGPAVAQLDDSEIEVILHRLMRLVGL